ncbi:MAG: Crp/Fnr family transcriptional regulator [Rhodospirillales bacterium]
MAKKPQKGNNPERSLNGISILVEVPPERIAQIEKKCGWLEFSTDDIIIDLDDTTTDVYFIVKGKVKVMDFMAENPEVALAELKAGDSMGELTALDSKKRSARVTAMTRTIVASLSSKDFRELLLDCPEMSLALLKRFASYIRSLNARLTSLSILSPHQRVYYELLRICEPNTMGDGSWIIINAPNHSEIASWVGAEKGLVADAIGKLARDGVIERRHRNFLIKDHARLQRLAEM